VSGAGFKIDPELLAGAGKDMLDVAARLGAAWQAFAATTRGMGDIFGDDSVGGLIGASYHAAEQIAEKSFRSVIAALQGFGDGLATMAANHENNESATAEHFHRLHRLL
jgi:hypothetical protein